MPIDLFTGQPGNGKTATMMVRLVADAEKLMAGAPDARPVYASGIDGLNVPGVIDLPDARTWNDKDATGAHIVPDGSIIYVDEAWKHFGHLQDASRAPNPPHVLALAEHRHRGLDFVWTTQMPNQIYPFARGLIGSHTHVVRRFGTQFVDLFTWGELQEDVKSAGKREVAQRKTTTLPKAVFDSYKSATLHTIKRRIPFKIIALPAVLVAALVVGYIAYQKMKPDAITARLQEKGGQPASAGGPGTGGTTRNAVAYSTAAEYATAFTPLIPEAPWTAPGFAGREVAAVPAVYCVISGAGETATGYASAESCRCITEQGTDYHMPEASCKKTARKGEMYNPFKAPPQEKERVVQGDQETRAPGVGQSPTETEAKPTAGNSNTDQMTGYGAFGAGASTSAP